jgi:hypothetical protein
MWIDRFKKFLKVVFGQPSLPLEIAFSSHYKPLAEVVGFLPIIVVAGHYSKVTWSALLPLLVVLSALPGAF